MGAHVSGHQNKWVDWLIRISKPKRTAASALVGLCAVGCAVSAFAYRPFDGTDAAVADLGEVEIEFQPIGATRAGQTKPVSDAILTAWLARSRSPPPLARKQPYTSTAIRRNYVTT